MGGVVSTGHDNDDLVNNLLHADYIKSPLVERVFRAVDRADYFLEEARSNAYKDLAWKSGNLHLSAPCIYSEVMEGLSLTSGLSFLNLGSGTGYLSTMIGLILGPTGVNHGIEIYEDVVQYANEKLEQFKKYSNALDEYEFCSPRFIIGNCLCLNPDLLRQYDRVYCGAACPEFYESYMKSLIKVGGILVMPYNDKLLKIRRVTETQWEETFLLSVSFASLIDPANEQEYIKMLDFEPLSLQSICRSAIRSILRKNIDLENPDIKKSSRNPPKRPKKKRALRRLVVPIFEEYFDNSDNTLTDDEERRTDNTGTNNATQPPPPTSNDSTSHGVNTFMDVVFDVGCIRKEGRTEYYDPDNSDNSSNEDDEPDNLITIEEEDDDDDENGDDAADERKTVPVVMKREKFDSGLGEELSNSESVVMDVDSEDSEDFMSVTERERKRSPLMPPSLGDKLKRIALSSYRMRSVVDSDSDSSDKTEEPPAEQEPEFEVTRAVYQTPYTPLMRAKIQSLPLPYLLKSYLNLFREF